MKDHNYMYHYEDIFWHNNKHCAGIDEAGRGPLVGPVVCALVIFPIGYKNDEIYDSKVLTSKKRKRLFYKIINDAVYYRIEVIGPKIIDDINILEASRLGMKNLALGAFCDDILTDAMKIDIDKNVIDIIKGDQKSVSIAAASILAKVYRDNVMEAMDIIYPKYEFKNHKGYPTKKHRELILKLPIIDEYRKTFNPVKEILNSK